MNFLVLSNGAPNYHNFFNYFAEKLVSDGHNGLFAVDSWFSVLENRISSSGLEYEVFESHFKRGSADSVLIGRYLKYNLNYALLSDFERSYIYGSLDNRGNDYYEQLKLSLLHFFESAIIKNNVDVVFYEGVSNTFAYFCWVVCQEFGVKYVGFSSTRLPGRFTLLDNPINEGLRVQEKFQQLLDGRAEISEEDKAFIDDYLERIETFVPDYMKTNGLDNLSLVNKYVKLEKAKKMLYALIFSLRNNYYSFQRASPLKTSWTMFKRSFLRKLRVSRLKSIYQRAEKDDCYLVYPLHFHPEASTSILAGHYLDEYEVIRNIAFNLPHGLKLYVKDHVSAYGYPSLNFYKKIAQLPNVILLGPEYNAKTLVKYSKGVITLSSTVGYEGLLLGKPVFLFGRAFYENHKNVIKIDSLPRLFEILSSGLETFEGLGSTEGDDYNALFVYAYWLSTLPGTLNLMLDEEAAKNLVDRIYPIVLESLAFEK